MRARSCGPSARRRIAPFLLLSALLLTGGCSLKRDRLVPMPPEVVKVRVPANLLECRPYPVARGDEDETELGLLVNQALAAGDHCRSQLRAVKEWSER